MISQIGGASHDGSSAEQLASVLPISVKDSGNTSSSGRSSVLDQSEATASSRSMQGVFTPTERAGQRMS